VLLVHAADAVAVMLLGALIAHWIIERQRLRAFVLEFGPLPSDPRGLALEVAGRLFERPHLHDDPPYLIRALAPLGATPSALIEIGGCCSGISRLYIHCLSQLGIRAHQIALYHRAGHAQHCLVEALLPEGPLIADPLYGVYYTDRAGRPIGLDALQSGVAPALAPLPRSDRTAYPANDYYDFAYSLSKTINWTKSPYRRSAYRLLTRALRGGVDRLRLPVALEWPQALLCAVISGMVIAMHIVALLVS
jgi:hypothetical protein